MFSLFLSLSLALRNSTSLNFRNFKHSGSIKRPTPTNFSLFPCFAVFYVQCFVQSFQEKPLLGWLWAWLHFYFPSRLFQNTLEGPSSLWFSLSHLFCSSSRRACLLRRSRLSSCSTRWSRWAEESRWVWSCKYQERSVTALRCKHVYFNGCDIITLSTICVEHTVLWTFRQHG